MLCCLCCATTALQATHIVGGEMNYTCLGGDDYEIRLTIFRDCYNGNPNAWFDDPASVGVFSAENELLFEVRIALDMTLNDTLQPTLSGSCFVLPPDVCVHTTTYTTTINLPPRTGGYQLAYQRCCRNETIVNVIDPLDTGATYGVTISEAALLGCNSSPRFKAWPPLYICVNEPIIFDQSAIDTDGDSVVYKLCTPLQGADPDIPQPQPPSPPPYDPIRWVNPPYSEQNMLNSAPTDPVLRINARTGLLTGLPNTVGQFVVGVCVEEYRAGQLIATTRRDFQYNVGVCGRAVAAFSAPEVQCNDLKVVFDNESFGSDRYLWDFGDGTTSTLTNPVHIFSDTGRYEISLIVDPRGICADTFRQVLSLQDTDITANFAYSPANCSDSLQILFDNRSSPPNDSSLQYQWSIDGRIVDTTANPLLAFAESGLSIVQLSVSDTNGCVARFSDSIEVALITGTFNADTLDICEGTSVRLRHSFDENLRFDWQPAHSLNDRNAVEPIAMPDTSTTYNVRISDADDFCQIERSVHVEVAPPIGLKAPNDTTICTENLLLRATSDVDASFQWTSGIVIISLEDSVMVSPVQAVAYRVTATDALGCSAADTVIVTGRAVRTALDSLQLFCPDSTASFNVINLNPEDDLSYDWQPSTGIQTGANTATPTVPITNSGRQLYTVSIRNQYGCAKVDSIAIVTIDTTEMLDLFTATQCSGRTVQFGTSGTNAPYYQWDFGDPTSLSATATGAMPSYTYPTTGTFSVTVTLPDSLSCGASDVQEVTVGESQIIVDFTTAIEDCADTATVVFTNTSVNEQSEILETTWRFADGTTSQLAQPTQTIIGSQVINTTLILTSSDGCVDSLTKIFPINLIEDIPPDTVAICQGQPTALYPDFNPNYQYQWSPTSTLDNPNAPNPIANPDSTTVYEVIISDAEGICQLRATVVGFVTPSIEFNAPGDTTICTNELRLQAQATTDYNYEWRTLDNPTTVLSTNQQVTLRPTGEQSYELQATDNFGCTQVQVFTVVNGTLELLLPSEQTICINHPLQLPTIHLNPSFETFYDWSPSIAIDDPTILQPTVNPTQRTIYRLTATNELGCTFMDSTRINVFDFVPPLDISTDRERLETKNDVAQLSATIASDYDYSWSPTEGLDDPTRSDPIAQPTTTTTYTLTITNRDGCTNTRSLLIEVLNLDCLPPNIFVPQAFTPNDDGKNDVLRVRGV
ncbi:MAG: PKD domain-containing protein, partial [Bacteroidota bacterium]